MLITSFFILTLVSGVFKYYTWFIFNLRSVLALSVRKIQSYFWSNLDPLISANTVQFSWADLDPRTKMGTSVCGLE